MILQVLFPFYSFILNVLIKICLVHYVDMKINHIEEKGTTNRDQDMDKTEESVVMLTDSEEESESDIENVEEESDEENVEDNQDDSLIQADEFDEDPPSSMFIRIYKEELSQSIYNTRPGKNVQFLSHKKLYFISHESWY